MKRIISYTILILTCITKLAFAQNGLKNGENFILQKSKNSIFVSAYRPNALAEKAIYPIKEKSIYATDQISRVAILDTTKIINLHNFVLRSLETITIPYQITPKTIFLTKDHIFIGGEAGKEMLIQYHIQTKKWFSLEIPSEVIKPGKAIDDIVITENHLIAIDNIVTPKYLLFYDLNTSSKLALSHIRKLKANGAYEHISAGRINAKYLALLSQTSSGYSGRYQHISIYDLNDMQRSFVFSISLKDKKSSPINDFAIVDDNLIIATKNNGMSKYKIDETFFSKSQSVGALDLNEEMSLTPIKYDFYEKSNVINLTPIPQMNKLVFTIEQKNGRLYRRILTVE